MKRLPICGFSVAILLALSGPVFADGLRPIATEAECRALVVGQKLRFGDDHVTARSNGQFVGSFCGTALKGPWAWRDRIWCRTLTKHARNAICHIWGTGGTTFRVTRKRGKGKSQDFILKHVRAERL